MNVFAHPKPMKRHSSSVVPATLNVIVSPANVIAFTNVHLLLTIDGATQRIVLNLNEAAALEKALAAAVAVGEVA